VLLAPQIVLLAPIRLAELPIKGTML